MEDTHTPRDPNASEAIRQKRLRLEELKKVAEIRESIRRYGASGAVRHEKSKRVGRYLLWFLLTLAVSSLAFRYYEYFVEPLIDAEFAPEAMRLFAWTNTCVAGMIGLLFFYHRNPVHHLSKRRRLVANALRYGGGLALLVGCILFWTEFYVGSVLVELGAGLVLWFARRYAKIKVSY